MTIDYKQELRDVLAEIDAVLEYDTPRRIARMMERIEPLIVREFGSCSGWGSWLAGQGFRARDNP